MNINGSSSLGPKIDPVLDSPSLSSRSSSFLSLSSNDSEADFEIISGWDNKYTAEASTQVQPGPINNIINKDLLKPSDFNGGIDRYLPDYLLSRVNSTGKAPLLLRPLAALLARFGIHGFGQTNCASCATAVAETVEKNVLYQAIPELRGADVKGNMGLPLKSVKSASELISLLQNYQLNDGLNSVIVVHRPKVRQILPGATQGHACNVIKYEGSELIHFIDAQKKVYIECHLNDIAGKSEKIRKFLGSVGNEGIDLYTKKTHEDLNKKTGAITPAL